MKSIILMGLVMLYWGTYTANAQRQKFSVNPKPPVVHLEKGAKNVAVPYRSIDVNFTNDSIQISGTLTVPIARKRYPSVIIVSGTGKQDRDGLMAGQKEFLQIADYLTRNGIAVLRMDDRGTGKTTGTYETATTGDFANDALAAVNYLRTRQEIDPAKIGLLGHSEGGAAISIAAAKSPDVKFLVSAAGLAMSGYEAQIRQNEDIISAAKLPDYNKRRYSQIDSIMFKTAYQYADSSNMHQKLNEAYDGWHKKDSVYFKSLNIEFDHFRFPIYSWSITASGPWFRYFIKYDAEKVMSQIRIPVLALNGDKDLMVAYKPNLENWKRYPAAGGNNDVTTVVMPDLNHLFRACIKCTNEENYELKQGFSQDALEVISQWINKRFNQN